MLTQSNGSIEEYGDMNLDMYYFISLIGLGDGHR